MLPDLAREFALPAAVLWRGLDPQAARGHDLIRWRGPAGGEVLLLPSAAGRLRGRRFALRRRDRRRRGVARSPIRAGGPRRRPSRGASLSEPIITGRTLRSVACRDRLAALEPEHEVRVSRLDDFLRLAADGVGGLPVVTGELRWSYGYSWTLQGVHATRAPLKRRNAGLAASAGAGRGATLSALAAPSSQLTTLLGLAWRGLVAAQFHDAIGGCSSDAVARELEVRFADVESIAREVIRRGVQRLVGHAPDRARESSALPNPRLILWNPITRPRSGVVLADTTWFRQDVLVGPLGGRRPRRAAGARPFGLAGTDGQVCAVQVIGRRVTHRRLDADRHYPDQDEVDVVRVALAVEHLPGLGFASFAPSNPGRASPGDVRTRVGSIGNGLVEVSIGQGGAVRLLDRVSGERYDGLLRLEDETDAGDTYTVLPGSPQRFAPEQRTGAHSGAGSRATGRHTRGPVEPRRRTNRRAARAPGPRGESPGALPTRARQ